VEAGVLNFCMTYNWPPGSLDDMTLKRWERLRAVNRLMSEIKEEEARKNAPPPPPA